MNAAVTAVSMKLEIVYLDRAASGHEFRGMARNAQAMVWGEG